MSKMAEGLAIDIATRKLKNAGESESFINAVNQNCAADAAVLERAGIYLFGSFDTAKKNLERLEQEIERVIQQTRNAVLF